MDEREAEIRKKARGRASLLAGSGFALLGHPRLAGLSYAVKFLLLGTLAAASFSPTGAIFGLFLGALVVEIVLWLIEIAAVGRISIRPQGATHSDSAQFAVALASMGVVAVATLACVVLNFGSMVTAGNGMAPVVLPGERFLYHKRVEPADLVPGALVTFGVSDRSSWGRPGDVVFARILAVPGDTLAISDGHYLVNGIKGAAVSPTGKTPITLEVEEVPGAIDVPPDCFFVIQEQSSNSLDSRQLSWARRKDLISTKHWLFSSRGFLHPLR